MSHQPIEGKLLGKQVAYPQNYTPQILVAVPRALNREMYGLNNDALPFTGVDVWHGYELSFLTQNGLPVTGVLKLVYSSANVFLVESKSLKLYLNSFNMERFGKNASEGVQIVLETIKTDLFKLLNTNIELAFFNDNTQLQTSDFYDYEVLEQLPEVENMEFNSFNESPELLVKDENITGHLKIATHLLRSNCKITHQPDWGSAFIYIKGNNLPHKMALLKYLVSIRNENHFHEEICEMIYKRLWDVFSPQELAVTCIYTRRGGIDICPVRVSHNHLMPKNLCNYKGLSHKLLRQ